MSRTKRAPSQQQATTKPCQKRATTRLSQQRITPTTVLKRQVQNPSFECPASDCHKTFGRLSDLKRHEKTHWTRQERERASWRCGWPACKYMALQKSNVAIHYRTHTNDCVHQCSTCDQGFTNQAMLIRHRKQHSNNPVRMKMTAPEVALVRIGKEILLPLDGDEEDEGLAVSEGAVHRGVEERKKGSEGADVEEATPHSERTHAALPRTKATSIAPPARKHTHPYVQKRSKTRTIGISPGPSAIPGRNVGSSASMHSHSLSPMRKLPSLPKTPPTQRRLPPQQYSPSCIPFRRSIMHSEPLWSEAEIFWTPGEDENTRYSLLAERYTAAMAVNFNDWNK
ncbi:hypothetical protein CYLTODRAFT_443500 [Cylindrobasidium torrendii FP15055 ss-10]|uniref:C2H2-type domain-containing protein n=1 Tax=Cylindrobasidium torrendii FP15055 ss-10 TaxID=1314674 RepID=A0A0D7BF61_9AGAR|nr:hypothetical protein CYLTODRAFT_443500 [Cylindrobasidium torrendii FP15055 ss-10]